MLERLASTENSGRISRYLIQGDSMSGKSSIAFRVAYEVAERGGSPLLICNRMKLESSFPLYCSMGEDLDASISSQNLWRPEVLSKIDIKYISTTAELKKIMAAIHCFRNLPSLIVIEDLSLLVDPARLVARNDPAFIEKIIQLAAFIDDAIKFIECRFDDAQIRLMVVDESFEGSFMLALSRCIQDILLIRSHSFNPMLKCIYRRSIQTQHNRLTEGELLARSVRLQSDVLIIC